MHTLPCSCGMTALYPDWVKTYLSRSGLNQNGPQRAPWGWASSCSKGQWRHQRLLTPENQELEEKKTRWKETLKFCSSHTTLKMTKQKWESRAISKESDLLASLCWGIWSLAWPGWPKDSALYPSTLINCSLFWSGASFPTISFDCFTSSKEEEPPQEPG